MSAPPTPLVTIRQLKEVAIEHLDYVYIGNVMGEGLDTTCPSCGALLLKRSGGIFIEHLNVDEKQCSKCGKEINIIGLQ